MYLCRRGFIIMFIKERLNNEINYYYSYFLFFCEERRKDTFLYIIYIIFIKTQFKVSLYYNSI